MVDKKNKKICIITDQHSVSGCGRLSCLLHYEEISIPWRMVRLTVLFLQMITQHVDELLFICFVSEELLFLHSSRHVLIKCDGCSSSSPCASLVSHVLGGWALIAIEYYHCLPILSCNVF